MSMKIDESQEMDSDAYSQARSGFRFGRQIIFQIILQPFTAWFNPGRGHWYPDCDVIGVEI
jgi:hypothetical protein